MRAKNLNKTEQTRLSALRRRAERLERNVARQLSAELRALPKRYGFRCLERFIVALQAAARGREVLPDAVAFKQRKRYTKRTPALRSRFEQLTREGWTISELAAELNLSPKSITNLRAEMGFAKQRQSPRTPAGRA